MGSRGELHVDGGHSSLYDALDAMDHTQWELDKMKRETAASEGSSGVNEKLTWSSVWTAEAQIRVTDEKSVEVATPLGGGSTHAKPTTKK